MTLVFATAISTWVLMVIMFNFFPDSGFLIDGTVAVIGGVIVGFIAAWIIRRQRRKERREGQ
jgi:membrane associated rhomboid family serine protease